MVFLALLDESAESIRQVFDTDEADLEGLVDVTRLQDFRVPIVRYQAALRVLEEGYVPVTWVLDPPVVPEVRFGIGQEPLWRVPAEEGYVLVPRGDLLVGSLGRTLEACRVEHRRASG